MTGSMVTTDWLRCASPGCRTPLSRGGFTACRQHWKSLPQRLRIQISTARGSRLTRLEMEATTWLAKKARYAALETRQREEKAVYVSRPVRERRFDERAWNENPGDMDRAAMKDFKSHVGWYVRVSEGARG